MIIKVEDELLDVFITLLKMGEEQDRRTSNNGMRSWATQAVVDDILLQIADNRRSSLDKVLSKMISPTRQEYYQNILSELDKQDDTTKEDLDIFS